jgi:hypothetical protein
MKKRIFIALLILAVLAGIIYAVPFLSGVSPPSNQPFSAIAALQSTTDAATIAGYTGAYSASSGASLTLLNTGQPLTYNAVSDGSYTNTGQSLNLAAYDGTIVGAINTSQSNTTETTAPAATSPPWIMAAYLAAFAVLLAAVSYYQEHLTGFALQRRHPLKILINNADISRLKNISTAMMAHTMKTLTGRRSNVAPMTNTSFIVAQTAGSTLGGAPSFGFSPGI